MKIACQSITFGNERHQNDIEGVFRTVHQAGYDGIELGFFRVDGQKEVLYKSLLTKYNLELAAIHIGGNFHDEESVKKQMGMIPDVIELAKAMDCKDIFMSGSRDNGIADYYASAGRHMNELGKMIKESGLTFSYHNHDWEIIDGMRGLNAILENSDEKYLSIVPDIGWVNRGGADPVEFVKKFYNRISNFHFKEFTAYGNFTELGKGVVNFKGVYDIIKDKKDKKDIWLIAEQDVSSIGAEESVTQNCRYIKNLIK